MPICQITLKASKPSKKPYPKELVTIGDHIKKKRLDLNLFQKDVARIVGVKKESICNWENSWSKPKVYLLPKIIEFLGYVPFAQMNQTLGDKIKSFRKELGLSQRKLAKLWGFDQTTIRDWENGRHSPNKNMRYRINQEISFNLERKISK